MCIAFDGAYILEARPQTPTADPGPAAEQAPVPEITTADAEHLEVSGTPT
jgi:hypothetical protein